MHCLHFAFSGLRGARLLDQLSFEAVGQTRNHQLVVTRAAHVVFSSYSFSHCSKRAAKSGVELKPPETIFFLTSVLVLLLCDCVLELLHALRTGRVIGCDCELLLGCGGESLVLRLQLGVIVFVLGNNATAKRTQFVRETVTDVASDRSCSAVRLRCSFSIAL